MIFMRVSRNDEIGTRFRHGDRGREGALDAEDFVNGVGEVRIDPNLLAVGGLEDESGTAEPPGAKMTWRDGARCYTFS